MRATLKLDKPDQLGATMTINMTIREWKELKAALTGVYAGHRFGQLISDLIAAAEEHFDQTYDRKAEY